MTFSLVDPLVTCAYAIAGYWLPFEVSQREQHAAQLERVVDEAHPAEHVFRFRRLWVAIAPV
jgi:hypothetical protein